MLSTQFFYHLFWLRWSWWNGVTYNQPNKRNITTQLMLSYIKYNKFINFQVPRHYLASNKKYIYLLYGKFQSKYFI